MRTGLVLEGGAIRTVYSCGVLDGFLKLGIDFDYVVGVSAGIADGVSYLSHQYGRNLELLTKYAADPRYMGARNMLKPGNRRCYFGLNFVYGEIPNRLVPFDYDAFDRWPGEAEAVVTNIETGRAEYRPVDPREPEMKLLQATCAMPLLFPIYDINGSKYLDGGCADAIPWRRALDKGCDRVVVVLTRERAYTRKPEPTQRLVERFYRRYPHFVETMRARPERCNQDRAALFQAEAEGKVFVFCPDSTEGFSRTERNADKIRALWRQGLDHAMARQHALQFYLNG